MLSLIRTETSCYVYMKHAFLEFRESGNKRFIFQSQFVDLSSEGYNGMYVKAVQRTLKEGQIV